MTASGFSGGCSCGAVRFTCSQAPLLQLVCHCRDCLKRTGPYTGILFVTPEALTLTGGTTTAMSTGGSGNPVHLSRCATCGSAVAAVADSLPGARLVLAKALDQASDFTPQFHVYVAGKPDWVSIDDALPRFQGSMH